MRLAVGIMTRNALAGLRQDLVEETLESLKAAFAPSPIMLFDNHSTDGTDELVARRGGICIRQGNGTPGAGRNAMLPRLYDLEPELVVLSDDDMRWHEGARGIIETFFGGDGVPPELGLVSGLLEPEYPWNTPRRVVTSSGVPVLVRDSCPGCAWIIPMSHLRARAELVKSRGLFKDDFGYDHDYCLRLAAEGIVVGQLDLATHLGWEASTHGNRAHRDARMRPLDRQKWGI